MAQLENKMKHKPTRDNLVALQAYCSDGIDRNKSPDAIWGLYCDSEVTPFDRTDIHFAYAMVLLTKRTK